MPRELVALGPRQPVLREFAEPPLGPGDVRIQTEFGAPKHGTEIPIYRGDAPTSQHRYDPDWRCFLPRDSSAPVFPVPLGNMGVGTVTAVGEAVTTCRVGDRVFGHLPLRDVHVVPARRVQRMPDGLSDEAAVCLDPADAAMAMRDAHVRLGDRAAVFGLGARGLFAVQYCRLSGADVVIAVDPVERRRALALALGADIALDPTACDAGLEIRTLTDRVGVDVALEVSSNAAALHHAIRGARYGGTVGVISVAHAGPALNLGQEFHFNRINLVSARTVSQPFPEIAGWDHRRVEALALKWLSDGKLSAKGIVWPIVPFDECVAAYQRIEDHPEESVKLGVRFPGGS
jgi:threonine dehydrogenase-like Zn-dependent dehydrogenase